MCPQGRRKGGDDSNVEYDDSDVEGSQKICMDKW